MRAERFFPPRPPLPVAGQARATAFDPALEAWLNAYVAYWKSEECVVLPKVAVLAMRSVAGWRRGPGVLDAVLPPGTPVGTFLTRAGAPATRWDGGEGLGITGNGTTHAGVLAGYLCDAHGGVLGIKLWEMYPGCGLRARRRICLTDDARFGSANARNYHAICEPDGRPLGGRDNPLFAACAATGADPARRMPQRPAQPVG